MNRLHGRVIKMINVIKRDKCILKGKAAVDIRMSKSGRCAVGPKRYVYADALIKFVRAILFFYNI